MVFIHRGGAGGGGTVEPAHCYLCSHDRLLAPTPHRQHTLFLLLFKSGFGVWLVVSDGKVRAAGLSRPGPTLTGPSHNGCFCCSTVQTLCCFSLLSSQHQRGGRPWSLYHTITLSHSAISRTNASVPLSSDERTNTRLLAAVVLSPFSETLETLWIIDFIVVVWTHQLFFTKDT